MVLLSKRAALNLAEAESTAMKRYDFNERRLNNKATLKEGQNTRD